MSVSVYGIKKGAVLGNGSECFSILLQTGCSFRDKTVKVSTYGMKLGHRY